jgi:hypothetical protein
MDNACTNREELKVLLKVGTEAPAEIRQLLVNGGFIVSSWMT